MPTRETGKNIWQFFCSQIVRLFPSIHRVCYVYLDTYIIYIYMYIYIYTQIHICIYIYIYTYMYFCCVYLDTYIIYIYTHTYIYAYIYIYTYMYFCYVYLDTYIICIYICTYIHTYIYVYIYIHICIFATYILILGPAMKEKHTNQVSIRFCVWIWKTYIVFQHKKLQLLFFNLKNYNSFFL